MIKKNLTLAIVATLVAGAPLAGHGQVDQSVIESIRQNDRHEHLLRVEAEQILMASRAGSANTLVQPSGAACVQSPFPSTPGSPVYKGQISNYSDSFSVDIWRVGCDSVNSNILVRVYPISNEPFICDIYPHVIQNEDQYDVTIVSNTDTYSSFCDFLLLPKTFLLGQSSSKLGFDDEAAFTLVWHGTYINIGPYNGTLSGCANGGISHYTPATGTLNIPSVELPSGKCYDATLQIIPPYDTLNFTLTGAIKK